MERFAPSEAPGPISTALLPGDLVFSPSHLECQLVLLCFITGLSNSGKQHRNFAVLYDADTRELKLSAITTANGALQRRLIAHFDAACVATAQVQVKPFLASLTPDKAYDKLRFRKRKVQWTSVGIRHAVQQISKEHRARDRDAEWGNCNDLGTPNADGIGASATDCKLYAAAVPPHAAVTSTNLPHATDTAVPPAAAANVPPHNYTADATVQRSCMPPHAATAAVQPHATVPSHAAATAMPLHANAAAIPPQVAAAAAMPHATVPLHAVVPPHFAVPPPAAVQQPHPPQVAAAVPPHATVPSLTTVPPHVAVPPHAAVQQPYPSLQPSSLQPQPYSVQPQPYYPPPTQFFSVHPTPLYPPMPAYMRAPPRQLSYELIEARIQLEELEQCALQRARKRYEMAMAMTHGAYY